MKRANTTSACIFERGVAMKTLLVMLVPLASSAVAQPSGTFTVTGSMTAPRSRHTATLLPDGRVLIAGGEVFPETLSGAELYDPRTGTFSATGNMTRPRSRHAATLLPDGRVLIAGGWFAANATALTSAELYDPRSGTFTGTGEMSSPAPKFTIGKWAPGSQASATLLQNGKVLLPVSCYARFGCSPAAELYDPETGTFAATGNSNFEGGDTATLLPNGRVLITRGNDPEGPYPSWAELYDPSTGAFSATGYPTTNQPGPTATLLMNGKVLLAGGDYGYGSGSPIAELYDPASGVFSRTADLTSGRAQHSTTLLPDGGVLFAGGHIVRGDSAEIYNPREGSFRRTATMTVARELHTATLLNDGRVLIAGGNHPLAGATFSSAEIYNPDLLIPAPVLFALSSDGLGQGAIWHAATGQIASAGNPAIEGEALSMYTTTLVEGGSIPPQVSVGGRLAEVLYFGISGYTGYNQVNFRMPRGVAPAPAAPVRLTYLNRSSNAVTIGVQ